MDNDGELRLTIMATLAQEESRKKNNGHTIQRDCVTVFISVVFAYAAASTSYWRCSLIAACVALMYGRGTFPCYADRGCAFSFSSHRAMQRIVGIAIEAEIPIKAVL